MATTLEETKEQLLRAVAEVVAESEKRTEANVAESTAALGAEIAKLRTDVHRVDDRITTAERNLRSDLNNMQQTILAAIDKLANPPK